MRAFTIIALAALLGACNSENSDDRTSETRAPETRRAEPGQREQRQLAREDAASPDLRILSILHVKNQEEIDVGRVARERGSSDEATKLGAALVKHHTEADSRLMRLTRSEGFNLIEPPRVKAMLAREQGGAPLEDPVAKLRTLSGKEFDAAFGRMMHEAHGELIRMVEEAQGRVQRPGVRDYLSTLLPTLREHERMAAELAGR